MFKRWVLFFVIIVGIACQVIPTPPPLKSTPAAWITPSIASTNAPLPQPLASATPAPGTRSTALPPGELPPFPSPSTSFAGIEPVAWQPAPYTPVLDSLPLSLEQTANFAVIAGLSSRERDFLAQNGFLVIHSREAQFAQIRQQVSLYYGQPYYLTSDAAYHALHQALSQTLPVLESQALHPRMLELIQAVLDEVLADLPQVQGTDLEADAQLAAAYLAVGLRLLDPQAALPADLEARIAPQVAQIMSTEGVQASVLIPGFQDDYRAYRPVDHYRSDPQLSAYYRGLTWFQRVDFRLVDPDPVFTPSRLPLIITLALRRAVTPNGPATQEWSALNEALSFLAGQGDDADPRQVAALMDQSYGRSVTILSLSDSPNWGAFLNLSRALPPSQISSSFSLLFGDIQNRLTWRFLSQPLSLDTFILQNLVYERVGSFDNPRSLPSGLDIPAVLGSPAAVQALQSSGANEYASYGEQLSRLQAAIGAQNQAQWLSSVPNLWLSAFQAQAAPKDASSGGAAFPPYMRTAAWSYADLNSALAGWAELKHDAAAPTRTSPTATANGEPGQIVSGPAPGYVEPNPTVFYHLAYLARSLADGLRQRSLSGAAGEELDSLLENMQTLGQRFQSLGDIAARQLAGLPLLPEHYQVIQTPLEPFQAGQFAQIDRPLASELPPVPVMSDILATPDQVLQAGLGLVDRLYVVVPLEGRLYIAQGGVYSYYEFAHPLDKQISNTRWREVVLDTPPPAMLPWATNFVLPEGYPVDVLAFRPGDVYRITKTGNRLNVRAEPSSSAAVLRQLKTGEYVRIIAGPTQAGGFTWWQMQLDPQLDSQVLGWAVENPAWYERVWGQ
ncbi:MAG: DUF3160 domain-containing protein [Chloroflexota bacterium]